MPEPTPNEQRQPPALLEVVGRTAAVNGLVCWFAVIGSLTVSSTAIVVFTAGILSVLPTLVLMIRLVEPRELGLYVETSRSAASSSTW